MMTGTIPGLNRPVSRIFFGTAIPPVMTDEPGAPELLDSVLAAGVNAFDCARSYGRAENALGRWIESRGCRDQVTVLSKCGDIRDGIVKVNREVIQDQLARSLDALRMNTVDIYLLHRDDPDTPVGEIIDTLSEARQAGQVRIFGVSNWTCPRIREANAYAAAHGLSGFSVSSPNYGLAVQVEDLWGGGCVSLSGPENRDARAWYAENQMPVIAYSSLGRGFFSGRFRSDDPEAAGRVLDPYARKGYLYPINLERLRRAETLADREGCAVSEIAMRYVFSSPMNVFAVVSTKSADRLRMNIRAAGMPLTGEDVSYLEGGDFSVCSIPAG
ncbi:MAG: aldo/keto reductase [Clostridia bacterium]|nr:aldo/keto reductase [Clostridia bacterium]